MIEPNEEALKIVTPEFIDSIGRVGNWRNGLGLAYPHFDEGVSVPVPFVRQRLTSLKRKKQKSLCNLRNLWLLLRFECYSNPLSKFPITEFLTLLLSCIFKNISFIISGE